jgi:hypothetical protein
VGFGLLTKQLAKQAISNQVADVVDSLRPPDAAAVAESLPSAKAAAAPGDNVAAIVIGQMQAMQNALKEDHELVALCTVGLETLRILEVYAPSPRVVVLTGIDSDKIVTRVVCPVESLQMVCKAMPTAPGSKAARIRFVVPKPA